MKKFLTKFFKEEDGTEVVEWATIIGLITVASLVAISGIASWVKTILQTLYDSGMRS